MGVNVTSGTRPDGSAYANIFSQSGRAVVINDLPLVELLSTNGVIQTLGVYGRVGSNYQVQTSTTMRSGGSWSPVLSYAQTNLAQTVAVSPATPVNFYRLQQQ
jgi:hypothetical protein